MVVLLKFLVNYSVLETQLHKFNPRPCRGGCNPPPHELFWNGCQTTGQITMKFCTAYGVSFAQLLGKKLLGQVRS